MFAMRVWRTNKHTQVSLHTFFWQINADMCILFTGIVKASLVYVFSRTYLCISVLWVCVCVCVHVWRLSCCLREKLHTERGKNREVLLCVSFMCACLYIMESTSIICIWRSLREHSPTCPTVFFMYINRSASANRKLLGGFAGFISVCPWSVCLQHRHAFVHSMHAPDSCVLQVGWGFSADLYLYSAWLFILPCLGDGFREAVALLAVSLALPPHSAATPINTSINTTSQMEIILSPCRCF